MSSIKNILFIMFDQLRFDYLSCSGHPTLSTPNIDRFARKATRFTRAYVQSPICGSSRMSFYTGRYVHSHGALGNGFPLKVGEMTLGDHLRANGMDAFLLGKTHMVADVRGMERLGITPDSIIGVRASECGFDAVIRDDGLWPETDSDAEDKDRGPYNEYLKKKGYPGASPWSQNANAGVTETSEMASGWFMEHANLPANVMEEDSETPWLTSRCIEFLEKKRAVSARPFLAHLSYIKPHWPYIVPAPYHDMYSREDVIPARRSERERVDPHPVYGEYMKMRVSRNFARDEVRERVIPAYMGLIKQCDDQMGRLFGYLEESGQMESTMIVLTSDHGDYLGDHWLGEKNLFHECSVKVPMIVYDPRPQADAMRGLVSDMLVESIDLAATFVDVVAEEVPDHILEGRSLVPLLRGEKPAEWRQVVVSEMEYSRSPVLKALDVKPRDARIFMVADERWKLVHFEGGFPPLLFDLEADPDEFDDLASDPSHKDKLDELYTHLSSWSRRMSQRTALSDGDIEDAKKRSLHERGIFIGVYSEDEVDPKLLTKLKGRVVKDFTR